MRSLIVVQSCATSPLVREPLVQVVDLGGPKMQAVEPWHVRQRLLVSLVSMDGAGKFSSGPTNSSSQAAYDRQADLLASPAWLVHPVAPKRSSDGKPEEMRAFESGFGRSMPSADYGRSQERMSIVKCQSAVEHGQTNVYIQEVHDPRLPTR
jgi:hypothetical protein